MRGARSNFLVVGVVLLLCFMPVVSAGLFDWFTGTGKVVTGEKCVDSDGGKNLLVPGLAQVGKSGISDYCGFFEGEGKIYESYCINDTAYGKDLLDCPKDKPYCNAGACSDVKAECTDSDDGLNKFVLGITITNKFQEPNSHSDYCESLSTNSPLNPCSGEDCGIREFACYDGIPSSYGNDIPCPNGCVDGACVKKVVDSKICGEYECSDMKYEGNVVLTGSAFLRYALDNYEEESENAYVSKNGPVYVFMEVGNSFISNDCIDFDDGLLRCVGDNYVNMLGEIVHIEEGNKYKNGYVITKNEKISNQCATDHTVGIVHRTESGDGFAVGSEICDNGCIDGACVEKAIVHKDPQCLKLGNQDGEEFFSCDKGQWVGSSLMLIDFTEDSAKFKAEGQYNKLTTKFLKEGSIFNVQEYASGARYIITLHDVDKGIAGNPDGVKISFKEIGEGKAVGNKCYIDDNLKDAKLYSCGDGQIMGDTGIVLESKSNGKTNLKYKGKSFSLTYSASTLLKEDVNYKLLDEYLIFPGENLGKFYVVFNLESANLDQNGVEIKIISTSENDKDISLSGNKLKVRVGSSDYEYISLGEERKIVLEDGKNLMITFASKFGDDFFMIVIADLDSKQGDGNPVDPSCDACTVDGSCVPVGYRFDYKYCSISGIKDQSGENVVCDNNHECSSNLCIDSACVEAGLWKKIMNWFSRIF